MRPSSDYRGWVRGLSGRSRRAARRGRGFTLIETALATVIISVGVLALLEAQATFTRSNDWSTESARGVYLATELRERLRKLPRHDPQTGLWVEGTGGSATLNGWGPEEGTDRAVGSYKYYDDLDDYDGLTFGTGGNFDGPIDAAGRVIPATGVDGTVILDDNEQPVPMLGWRQSVKVEKVDPFNPSTGLAKDFAKAATSTTSAVAVDDFPLRVTVTVMYQGPFDTAAREMAKLVWVQP